MSRYVKFLTFLCSTVAVTSALIAVPGLSDREPAWAELQPPGKNKSVTDPNPAQPPDAPLVDTAKAAAPTRDEPAVTKARSESPRAGHADVVAAPLPQNYAAVTPRKAIPPQPNRDLGFVSKVGTFQRRGYTIEAAYRFRDPSERRFRFYNSRFDLVFSAPIRFGSAGSITGFQQTFLASVYKDEIYDFWIAISDRSNPDGTYNLAFSFDVNQPFGWYWWDDDMRGFPYGD
ncbi:hypothetical protein Isop_2912 [Isosphaera pallida ATCC 43644]|uniref:Uncharacterized protein n=1 Tax=Isosphaera pallida (strain ATCC 43644 / DSM 9630 / IS1B) TaxID=575540 RepID=E8R247_ISOPI|nr:hypothetical protein [Isosphaera pallida]ADV63477.1 hypothetical protein Isop_2912 [Isosphaera pallida ATCC 43644]